jgi:hypothetical protein
MVSLHLHLQPFIAQHTHHKVSVRLPSRIISPAHTTFQLE